MSKKTDERIKILLSCLEDNMSIKKACGYAKITEQTYQNWVKSDPKFLMEVEFAKSAGVRRLCKLSELKDPWKMLKSKDPEEFKEDPNLQINVQVNNYDKYLDELHGEELLEEGRRLFGINDRDKTIAVLEADKPDPKV